MKSGPLLLACAAVALSACNQTKQATQESRGGQSSAAIAGSSSGDAAAVVTPSQAPYTGNPSAGQTPNTASATQQTMQAGAPLNSAAFVAQAAGSDMYEIAEARMALQKSQNPAVKAFAQKMIHDHTASTAELKAALGRSGQNLSMPGAPSPQLEGQIHELAAASGQDFDRRYIDQQVTAHQQALNLMQTYDAEGDNAALKRFANQAAAVIQGHLLMAQKIQGQLKPGSPGSPDQGS